MAERWGDGRPDSAARPVAPEDADEALLEESLRTVWNARVVEYDAGRFPFADWILERIRAEGHALDDLERLHEVVPDAETYALSKRLCDATSGADFRALVRAFVLEEIAPRGRLRAPLAVQRFLNVRIMLPAKPQAVFPFHTGLLYGHGRGSRSLWMPLTDVRAESDASAAMQIIDLERSRELLHEATSRRLTIAQMTELFGRESHPVLAGPGQVCLFSQEHIHGNFVNRTDKTRVSIDFRVAEARFGDQLARKHPGGYFEILGPDGEAPSGGRLASRERPTILYLNNNTSHTEPVPAHLQRYMVCDYCARHAVPYEFEMFELETMEHLPTLHHIVGELRCNVVLYSIYALPEDPAHRAAIFDTAEAGGVGLVFVNEDLVVQDSGDRERVEELLSFAKYGG